MIESLPLLELVPSKHPMLPTLAEETMPSKLSMLELAMLELSVVHERTMSICPMCKVVSPISSSCSSCSSS